MGRGARQPVRHQQGGDRQRVAGDRGIIFDIDHQGARQIKCAAPDAVAVFILPPSMSVLEQRLRGRASEDEETVQRRFGVAKREIEHYGLFDYVLVNAELEEATKKLTSIFWPKSAAGAASRRSRSSSWPKDACARNLIEVEPTSARTQPPARPRRPTKARPMTQYPTRSKEVADPVLIVGSMAFDDLELPSVNAKDVVGGAATYAAYAASLFSPVRIVAVVGEDFPNAVLEDLARATST